MDYSYNGVVYGSKDKWAGTRHISMDEFQNGGVEWKKQVSKYSMVYFIHKVWTKEKRRNILFGDTYIGGKITRKDRWMINKIMDTLRRVACVNLIGEGHTRRFQDTSNILFCDLCGWYMSAQFIIILYLHTLSYLYDIFHNKNFN